MEFEAPVGLWELTVTNEQMPARRAPGLDGLDGLPADFSRCLLQKTSMTSYWSVN